MKKLFLTLISCFAFVALLSGCAPKKDSFYKDYKEATNETLFKTLNEKELVDFLEHGTGVLFLSFPQCPWCHTFLPVLEESAKQSNTETIYYFNMFEDRKNNTKLYQTVCGLLEDELDVDSDGNVRIFVPDVTVVKEGKILYHTNETSMLSSKEISPSEYWSDDTKEAAVSKLTEALKQLH